MQVSRSNPSPHFDHGNVHGTRSKSRGSGAYEAYEYPVYQGRDQSSGRELSRILLGSSAERSPVIVSRIRPEWRAGDKISTKATITSVLKSSAGAAVADAMSKIQDPRLSATKPTITTYRAIERPRPSATEIVLQPPQISVRSVRPPYAVVYTSDDSASKRSQPFPRVSSASQSEYARVEPAPSQAVVLRRTSTLPAATKTRHYHEPVTNRYPPHSVSTYSQNQQDSRGTGRKEQLPTPVVSKFGSSKVGRAESVALSSMNLGSRLDDSKTIVPGDSISQVSSNRSSSRSRSARAEDKKSRHKNHKHRGRRHSHTSSAKKGFLGSALGLDWK